MKDREQAAKDLNVGISTLDRARKIQKQGSPELVAAVESGEVTVGAAYKVADLPKEEQREVVAAGPEAAMARISEFRHPPWQLACARVGAGDTPVSAAMISAVETKGSF